MESTFESSSESVTVIMEIRAAKFDTLVSASAATAGSYFHGTRSLAISIKLKKTGGGSKSSTTLTYG